MAEAPLYRLLADEIQALIERGSIRVGHRLPSVRVTARQRQISIGTALEAYVLLENRGTIEARPKSGYYVRSPRPATADRPDRIDLRPGGPGGREGPHPARDGPLAGSELLPPRHRLSRAGAAAAQEAGEGERRRRTVRSRHLGAVRHGRRVRPLCPGAFPAGTSGPAPPFPTTNSSSPPAAPRPWTLPWPR